LNNIKKGVDYSVLYLIVRVAPTGI